MENIEEKIGAILNNPQLMQQIMATAQSLGSTQPQKQENASNQTKSSDLVIDPALIQKISGLTQHARIDSDQHALLCALSPYLSQDRISRLERAMRAAKIAKYASSILGTNSLSLLTGR